MTVRRQPFINRREAAIILILIAVLAAVAVLFLGTQTGPVADIWAALGLPVNCPPRIIFETGPCAVAAP